MRDRVFALAGHVAGRRCIHRVADGGERNGGRRHDHGGAGDLPQRRYFHQSRFWRAARARRQDLHRDRRAQERGDHDRRCNQDGSQAHGYGRPDPRVPGGFRDGAMGMDGRPVRQRQRPSFNFEFVAIADGRADRLQFYMVLAGYRQKSTIRHFSQRGWRATQT